MAGNGEMKAHRETYAFVTSLLKWGALACFVIAFAVIVLIAHK